MRIYTVHVRRHGLDPDRDLVLVKEGFSWPAFFFGGVWALAHRLWWVAIILFAVVLAVEAGLMALAIDSVSAFAVSLGLALVIGGLANDLRRRVLDRRGFAFAGVVAGDNRDHALRRYLESAPELARDLGDAAVT